MPSLEATGSLRVARGALRDVVASLQNLHALLRSPRVGPKAIAAVLPEIRESSAPAGAAVRTILAELGGQGAAVAAELIDYVEARAAEISSALSRAEGGELDARKRLALEADVARLLPLMDAARGLVDLAHTAALEAPVELDLAELLAEALVPPSQRGALFGPAVTVTVTLPAVGDCALVASPRVAIPLINLAIAHVFGGRPRPWTVPAPRLHGGCGGKLRGEPVALEVDAAARAGDPPRGEVLVLRPPPLIEPTAAVARLVAGCTGAELVLDEGRPLAVVRFRAPG